MASEPDTTDWTWVLERTCPQCGLTASALDVPRVTALLADAPAAWRGVLARSDAARRPGAARPDVARVDGARRPDATRPGGVIWSPLEYAAHVRDVLRVFDGRFAAMLGRDDPTFDDWDQDAAALAGHYPSLPPATVADELAQAADAVRTRLAAVPPAACSRTGRRGDGHVFTVTTLAQYLAHELVHHAWDVRAD